MAPVSDQAGEKLQSVHVNFRDQSLTYSKFDIHPEWIASYHHHQEGAQVERRAIPAVAPGSLSHFDRPCGMAIRLRPSLLGGVKN
jgi:hypothetical protein